MTNFTSPAPSLSPTSPSPPTDPLTPAPATATASASPYPYLSPKSTICTCALPPSTTYLHPLILCASKSRCKIRIFHLHCVGLTAQQRALMNPDTWFCESCRGPDQIDVEVERICVCDVSPYMSSGPMVRCARVECRVRVWHWVCAGFPGGVIGKEDTTKGGIDEVEAEGWVCGECRVDDALGENGGEEGGEVRGNVVRGETQQEPAPRENVLREEETQQDEAQPIKAQHGEILQKRTQQLDTHQGEPQPEDGQQDIITEKNTQQHDSPQEEPQGEKQEDDTTTSPPLSKRQKTSSKSSPSPRNIPHTTNGPAPQLRPANTATTPLLFPSPAPSPDPDPAPQPESQPDPEYCLCGTPTDDSMIGCNGRACKREWYHYECVGLTAATVPRGKWVCEECREEEVKKRNGKGKNEKGKQGKGGSKKRKR